MQSELRTFFRWLDRSWWVRASMPFIWPLMLIVFARGIAPSPALDFLGPLVIALSVLTALISVASPVFAASIRASRKDSRPTLERIQDYNLDDAAVVERGLIDVETEPLPPPPPGVSQLIRVFGKQGPAWVGPALRWIVLSLGAVMLINMGFMDLARPLAPMFEGLELGVAPTRWTLHLVLVGLFCLICLRNWALGTQAELDRRGVEPS